MNIYELSWTSQNEKEWISGRTNIEALKTYLATTGTDIIDLDDLDEIVEVPKENWSNMFVINNEFDPNNPNNKLEITFEEWMKENKTSEIIAGTMY